MIIVLILTISLIATIAATATAVRSRQPKPAVVEGRLARVLPNSSRSAPDSAFQRRQYDWTVEYDSPVGAQRVVLNQNPSSFGEFAAVETARTTAMLYRGATIEVWTEHRETGERVRVDAIRMESRRAA